MNIRQTFASRAAIGSLALSMLLSSLGVSITNAALPALAEAFHATFHEVQGVILAYLLSVTILIVFAGRLGDLFGRRRVLLAGILLYTGASLLCGLSPTLWLLISARVLQGLGGAILVSLTIALASETVEKEKAGRAMGLMGSMSAVGTALGPSLSGFLLAGLGWRGIFFVLVPLGVFNFFLASRYLPVRLAEVSFSIDKAADKAASKLWIGLRSFRNLSFSANLAMNTIVSTVMMSTLVIGPFYLSRTLSLSPTWVGIVMSVGPCMSMLSGVPAGRIVDQLGASRVLVLGLTQMILGTAALTVLPSIFGLPGYVMSVIILSPGYQLFLASNNTAVMSNADSDQRGMISSLLSLSRNLGLITGASVMGAVFSMALQTDQVTTAAPESVAHGMRVTFMVATALATVALATAIQIQSRSSSKKAAPISSS